MTNQNQDAIAQIKQSISKQNLSYALSLTRNALEKTDEDEQINELLYMKSVIYRLSQSPKNALETLDLLLERRPDYGRAYQEKGYCYKQLGESKLSANSFYQATRFNQALLSAWRQLLDVYKETNNQEALRIASHHVEYLQSLPAPVLGAYDLMYEGQLHKAEKLCRQFLQKNRHEPEAMMLLAEIGSQLKVYHDSEFLLESCVTLYPDNEKAANAYQALLNKLGKFAKLVAFAKQRLSRNSDNIGAKLALANGYVGIGESEKAISLFNEMLKNNNSLHGVWLSLGHALKAKGELKEAVSAYRQAAALQKDFGDAYWSLANTKTYKFEESDIALMREVESSPTTQLDDRIHLCFALGKALEDAKSFEESFFYYRQGNLLKKKTLSFDITRLEKAMDAQKKVFPEIRKKESVKGYPAKDPIFIVGLPRAGSTLLEQILASHSQIDGTMELHDILGIASSLSSHKEAYPYNLATLDDDYAYRLGKLYIEQTRVYRQDAPFFIDKMPNNFIHIGLIKKILPNAKIIDARRNAMDCCFSGYKQLFGEGQEFSYSLSDIGRYYNAYEKLMSHWHTVMPGDILTVQHEDVLDDLEGQVKRILAFCGLEFEEACLAFHKTKRIIKTPSSEQVRQPIYKTGMGQWKPFESNLEALKDALKTQ